MCSFRGSPSLVPGEEGQEGEKGIRIVPREGRNIPNSPRALTFQAAKPQSLEAVAATTIAMKGDDAVKGFFSFLSLPLGISANLSRGEVGVL